MMGTLFYRSFAVLAVLYGAAAVGYHFYADTTVDLKWWISSLLCISGGAMYLVYELFHALKGKIKLPKTLVDEKTYNLEDARYHIDELMKIGQNTDNKTITDAMVNLNNEIFKLYHKI